LNDLTPLQGSRASDHEIDIDEKRTPCSPASVGRCQLTARGSEDLGVSPRHSDRRPKQLGSLDRESGELWLFGPGYAGH
jgi:hypothetical protein